MAYVYKATHLDFDQHVAVKVLFAELARREDVAFRFKREAKIQFRLQHPNMIRVFDLISEDGILGMAMDWVEGEELGHYLKKQKILSFSEIQRFMHPILAAVGYAHERQVIHRDLKPSNILLEKTGGLEVIKVMDFGIAKLLDDGSHKTKTGAILGTPHFMAPEAATDNKALDLRVDIYALGIILYQMATGYLPYVGDSAINIIMAHCVGSMTPPRELTSDIPAELEDIILKATSKNREERYQSCQEFSEALETFFQSLPEAEFTRQRHVPSAVSESESSPAWSLPTNVSNELSAAPTRIPDGKRVETVSVSIPPRNAAQSASLSTPHPQHSPVSTPHPQHSPVSTPHPQYSPVSEVTAKGLGKGFHVLWILVVVGVFGAYFLESLFSRNQQTSNVLPKGRAHGVAPLPHTRENQRQSPVSRRVQPPVTRSKERWQPTKLRLSKPRLRVKKSRPIRRKANNNTRRRISLRSSRWRRCAAKGSFTTCKRCVQRTFERLHGSSKMPSMFASDGSNRTCNVGDFYKVGRSCAQRCGCNYFHYSVAFLQQPFGKGYIAGSRSPCRDFVLYKRNLRKLRRYYGTTASRKQARHARRRWKSFRQ